MDKLKQPRKDSDPEQLERFKRTAREVEADETPGALDRVFDEKLKQITQAKLSPKMPIPKRNKGGPADR
jgi:hypothetical protein